MPVSYTHLDVYKRQAYVGANMRFIPHQGEKESLEIIKKVADKYGLETEVLHANDYTTPVEMCIRDRPCACRRP